MRRLAAALLVPLLLTASACGDDSSSSADPGTSSSGSPTTASGGATDASADAVTIDVTVNGSDVTPNGDRVPVKVGQQVILDVTADAPGEIHVHSTPGQEFEYESGETKLTVANLDQPGIVTIESHTLDKVIVQLEVS